jgi:hypothetical protein
MGLFIGLYVGLYTLDELVSCYAARVRFSLDAKSVCAFASTLRVLVAGLVCVSSPTYHASMS